MIIDKLRKSDVTTEGLESKRVQIDTSSIAVLQHILSEGLYEAPIDACVVEVTNNAVDSVIEAGKDPIQNPIIVSLYQENDNYFFSVKDEGLGIDEEGFEDLIGFYLKSTKRNSNETIGHWGIGKMAPLSVSDSFYWVCRKDGKERKFVIFKGEEFTEFTKVYEKDTDEVNGVEVIVPVKYGDVYNFERACKQKLCYYDTVTMIIRGQLISDYKIYREEDFQFNTLYHRHEMHICLKDVVYDIDWNKLGRRTVYLPVALRFGLGDKLLVTPSREGLIYNKEVVKIINDKINKVEKWFIDKYNESVKGADVKVALNKALYNKYQLNIYEQTFNLNSYSSLLNSPSIKGVDNLSMGELIKHNDKILFDYDKLGHISNNRYVGDDWGGVLKYVLGNTYTVILAERKPSGKTMEYIKDIYGDDAVFVKKNDRKRIGLWRAPGNLAGTNDWHTFLGLKNVPRANWRKCFDELKMIREELLKNVVDIEDIKPTEEWLNQNKVAKARKAITRVDKAEINPKWAMESSGYNSLCKFESEGVSAISTFDKGVIFVYGKIEDKERLGGLYNLARPIQNFKVCVLVERDVNRVIEAKLTNWLNIDEFMEGKLAVFGETCTAQIIKQFIGKYSLEFQNTDFISTFNKELADKMVTVEEFMEKYSRGLDRYTDLLKDMLQICEKENLWKKEEYDLYNEIVDEIEDLSFLKFLKTNQRYGYGTATISESCADFAKEYYNNLKINKLQTV